MGDSSVPAPGEVIAGRYCIESVVGEGGVGVVLAAVHLELGHRVAVKVLGEHRSAFQIERFRREAQLVARLQTEHVARVTDFGLLASGAPYAVMDYLEGRDLEEELKARGPLPIEEAVGYILAACEALAEAHANGIVHRDIKPKNMFLARKVGGVTILKVLDFGLAKAGPLDASITRTQDIFGSPAYMAPEQMRSAKDVDARADIWALGATLYELLTGAPPFEAPSVAEVCALVLKEPAPSVRSKRPDVTHVLARIIDKCLQKEPQERFGTILELVQRLEAFGAAKHAGIAKHIEAIAASTPSSGPFLPLSPPSQREPSPTSRSSVPGDAARAGRPAGKSSLDISVELPRSEQATLAEVLVVPGPTRRRAVAAMAVVALAVLAGVALVFTRPQQGTASAALLAAPGQVLARAPAAAASDASAEARAQAPLAASAEVGPPQAHAPADAGSPSAGGLAVDAAAAVRKASKAEPRSKRK
ncbi:MAG: serine/threonine protein kinase [Myxococcales bacterium]|nr:serine/threonine protein kinase [Myxococcales bacterium]